MGQNTQNGRGCPSRLLASRFMEQAGFCADAATPVLRWAGGKRWLTGRIRELLVGLDIGRYHEPFLGGASIFLGLPPRESFLSDLNAELIETYSAIRDIPDAIAERLVGHENSAEHYYRTRGQVPTDRADRAARFIYLNHHSFNGIHRVNLKGVYNVPFGNRGAPNVPGLEDLVAVSERLRNATLAVCDFDSTIANVQQGDLVFVDPPYTVAHNHNGFIRYNQKLFSFSDQERLSIYLDKVRSVGAYYIMTNAAHESIARLFEKGDRRFETSRRNNVGGIAAARGVATEYLFTNVPS